LFFDDASLTWVLDIAKEWCHWHRFSRSKAVLLCREFYRPALRFLEAFEAGQRDTRR